MWRSQGLGEGSSICELFSGGQRCKHCKALMAGGGECNSDKWEHGGGGGGKKMGVPACSTSLE